jgi:hypothetical protein
VDFERTALPALRHDAERSHPTWAAERGRSGLRLWVAIAAAIAAILAAGLELSASAGAATPARDASSEVLDGGGQPLILKPGGQRVAPKASTTRRSATRTRRNSSTRHPPAVTTAPSNVSVAAGALASFSAAASGSPTPSVQWQRSANRGRSWSDISGANALSYSFVASASESGSWYRVVFVNSLGRAYTTAGTLTVTAATATAPSVVTQPASQSVAKNGVAAFSATATGYPAPSVQWQDSSNGGSSWTNVAGATSSTYQFIAATSESGYLYRAVFANASGSAASAAATLTVNSGTVSSTGAPAVTANPISQTVGYETDASFSAQASGNPTPTVQWQISSNRGTSWTNVSGANATTYSFDTSLTENGYEYRAVFDNSSGSAYSTAATLTVAEQSSNWSGYAVTGGVFSSVSGSWTVPAISCAASSTSFSSQWIGIDGESSDTVEQDGTEADCVSGSPYYGAWYEMYGDPSVDGGYEVPLSNPVDAGDAMSATVAISGTTWTLAITDTTQNWHFSIAIPTPSPAPAQSSAEWIGERPMVCSSTCGLATLSNFGSISFSSATATDAGTSNGPISAFSFEPLEMVGSTVLAAPGALSSNGEGFTDTWDAGS